MSLRRLFRFPWRSPKDVTREVDEELAFHLDALTEDLVARGMTPAEARAEAERRFGSVDRARETLQRADLRHLRELRFREWLGALGQDLRFGARQLRRSPGFALVATLTLALGVGANTLAFSLLYGSLFRTLPFAEPDRLAVLLVERRGDDQSLDRFPWTYPQYHWLTEQRTPFVAVAAFNPGGVNLSGEGDPERIAVEVVSESYFPTLGTRAIQGRTFLPEEDATPGTHPVTVLGYSLWRRRFGEDPRVVGREIRVNARPLTVVGVMPPGFTGVSGNAELWIPEMMAPSVTFDRQLTSNDSFHRVIARFAEYPGLAPAVSQALGRQLLDAVPGAESAEGAVSLAIVARPLSEIGIDPGRRRSVILLFGAVWLVLAVACVNLAALELARARVRVRELAVRLALGAGRARLVRQLVTEGTLLALLGCGASVGLAAAGATLLRRISPVRLPTPSNLYAAVSEFASIELHPTVLAFALAVSLATVLLVSLVPSLRASRPEIVQDLRQGTPGDRGAGWTLRRPGILALLTVAQVALALVLAVGAGLLLKSFALVQARGFGFDPSGVITFRISPPDPTFSVANAPALIAPVLERVEQVPSVESATVSMCTPFMATCGRQPLYFAGREAGEGPTVGVHYVGPDHFRTLRIPLTRGRAFTPRDRAGAPRVAIINESAARRFFPGEDPTGRRIVVGGTGSIGADAWEIVGVVGDVTYWPVEEPPRPDVYLPYLQFTYASTYVTVRSRPTITQQAVMGAIREAVRSVDPDLPLEDIRTMEDRIGLALSGRRFVAHVLAAFAALAFGLAAVGVYGVASYSVSQRTREMGIRQALGAAPSDVFRLVVAEGAVVGGVGLIVGLGLAVAASRVLRALLVDVSTTDPVTYAVVATAVGVAAIAATAVPARRATRADPMSCLRAD